MLRFLMARCTLKMDNRFKTLYNKIFAQSALHSRFYNGEVTTYLKFKMNDRLDFKREK